MSIKNISCKRNYLILIFAAIRVKVKYATR